jgi:hypothetical protein
VFSTERKTALQISYPLVKLLYESYWKEERAWQKVNYPESKASGFLVSTTAVIITLKMSSFPTMSTSVNLACSTPIFEGIRLP